MPVFSTWISLGRFYFYSYFRKKNPIVNIVIKYENKSSTQQIKVHLCISLVTVFISSARGILKCLFNPAIQ